MIIYELCDKSVIMNIITVIFIIMFDDNVQVGLNGVLSVKSPLSHLPNFFSDVCMSHKLVELLRMSKKAVPLQAWSRPEGFRK